MIVDLEKPFFMALKNIKSNISYDISTSDEFFKANPEEQNNPNWSKKWELVTWNKSPKQSLFFNGNVSVSEFVSIIDLILKDSASKQKVFADKTANELIDKYIKTIKGEWLFDLSEQRGIIYVQNNAIVYDISMIEDGISFVFYSALINKDKVSVKLQGTISKSKNRIEVSDNCQKLVDNDDKPIYDVEEFRAICGTYLRLLFFLQFAEVETKITNNKTRKIKIGNDKFLNNSDFNLEVIDMTYYTNIIRTEGFGVIGHWRYQPYGTGRLDKKLIWIKDFQKHGYEKRAKILSK